MLQPEDVTQTTQALRKSPAAPHRKTFRVTMSHQQRIMMCVSFIMFLTTSERKPRRTFFPDFMPVFRPGYQLHSIGRFCNSRPPLRAASLDTKQLDATGVCDFTCWLILQTRRSRTTGPSPSANLSLPSITCSGIHCDMFANLSPPRSRHQRAGDAKAASGYRPPHPVIIAALFSRAVASLCEFQNQTLLFVGFVFTRSV